MRNFKYGACNKRILPQNRMIRKQYSTRLNGWLFGDKVEAAAEASADLALTAKKQVLIATGILKNTSLVATGEIINNGTQLLDNLTGIANQLNFAGQGLAFSCSVYNTGISITDFCLCPTVTGKILYGAAAICSSASVVTTGCSMGTGKLSPSSSYALGMSGVAFRCMSRYITKVARTQNPSSIESIL